MEYLEINYVILEASICDVLMIKPLLQVDLPKVIEEIYKALPKVL